MNTHPEIHQSMQRYIPASCRAFDYTLIKTHWWEMRAWITTSHLFTPPWQEGGVELTYLSKHPLLKIGPFVSVLYIVGKYSEVILMQSYQPAKSKAKSTRLSSYNSKNQCQICRSTWNYKWTNVYWTYNTCFGHFGVILVSSVALLGAILLSCIKQFNKTLTLLGSN